MNKKSLKKMRTLKSLNTSESIEVKDFFVRDILTKRYCGFFQTKYQI